MELVPGGARDGFPEPLGDFLNAIVAGRRGIRGYVLSWDFAMLYSMEREWLPIYKLDWRTHRRLSFRLDDRHPPGTCHHQKVVVVDDAVAFVSGYDLTRARWDTCAHDGSCGKYLSSRAYGHTGFTGTSLWIDPDRDLFVILLTNRVHAARARRPSKVIADVRADVADAAALAVRDAEGDLLAMPASFRADRAVGWNRPIRSRSRRSKSKKKASSSIVTPIHRTSSKTN